MLLYELFAFTYKAAAPVLVYSVLYDCFVLSSLHFFTFMLYVLRLFEILINGIYLMVLGELLGGTKHHREISQWGCWPTLSGEVSKAHTFAWLENVKSSSFLRLYNTAQLDQAPPSSMVSCPRAIVMRGVSCNCVPLSLASVPFSSSLAAHAQKEHLSSHLKK